MDDEKFLEYWKKFHEKGKINFIKQGVIIATVVGIVSAIMHTLILKSPIIILTFYPVLVLGVGIPISSFSWNYYERKYNKILGRKATSNNSRPYGSQTEVCSTQIHLR